MPGTLYVVATPIGNLEDVTLRALRILREVSLIAAEDTRRTGRLLQHYSISTPTTSFHDHNEQGKAGHLVEKLAAGASIALVSDAGTPVISDPGQRLVEAAREAGISIEAIPGPSAVMTALSIAGLPFDRFLFAGFPPPRSKARKDWLRELVGHDVLAVIFEAPHRLRETLSDLAGLIGPGAPVGLGRELTKLHQEFVVHPISTHLDQSQLAKGEFTVLIPACGARLTPESGAEGSRYFGHSIESDQRTTRDAVKKLARITGLPANVLYQKVQEARKLVE